MVFVVVKGVGCWIGKEKLDDDLFVGDGWFGEWKGEEVVGDCVGEGERGLIGGGLWGLEVDGKFDNVGGVCWFIMFGVMLME